MLQKMPQKITVSLPGKTPAIFEKKNTAKNQTISMPYLLQAQAALALLLACYCGSTTMCRRNDNCVDPNKTES